MAPEQATAEDVGPVDRPVLGRLHGVRDDRRPRAVPRLDDARCRADAPRQRADPPGGLGRPRASTSASRTGSSGCWSRTRPSARRPPARRGTSSRRSPSPRSARAGGARRGCSSRAPTGRPGPLTPAPFDRQTPPAQEASAGYETYLGDSPAPAAAAPPPPPPPAQPPATLEGQPLQPVPPAAGPAGDGRPGRCGGTDRDVPVAGGERRPQPAHDRGRDRPDRRDRRGRVPLDHSRGSGSAQTTTTTKHHQKPQRRPCRSSSRCPRSSRQGKLQSVAPFGGHAWALDHKKPRQIVDLQGGPPSAFPAGKGAANLASGEGALWVSANTPTGGEVRRFVPGSTAPPSAPIPFPGAPPARASS